MSHHRSRIECWLAAALIAAGPLLSGFAQGVLQKAKPLQFSRPQSPNFTNSIGGKLAPATKDELEDLGDALFRTEQPVAPKSSMELVVPYMPRALPSKKALRELNERRQEMMFGNPETLANTLSPEQDSQASDETGRKLSAVEEYYQKVVRQQKGDTTDKMTPPGTKNETDENDDRNLPAGLKERTKQLQALLGIEQPQGQDKDDESLFGSELFKGKSAFTFSSFEIPQTPSREVLEERKTRLQEFRQMTGVPAMDLSPIEMFKQLGASTADTRTSVTPGSSAVAAQLPGLVQDNSAAQFGALPSPAAIPDVNRGLSLPSIAPSTPKPDPQPVRLPPPSPTFVAPKRPF